jgi:hypothetical protein
MTFRIICQSAELAVECLQAAQVVGLEVAPEVSEDWIALAQTGLRAGRLAIALSEAPELTALIELGHASRETGHGTVLALVERSAHAERLRQVALDLGITAVHEVEPLMAALCLLDADAQSPWTAAARTLGRPDRARLQPALSAGPRTGNQLIRDEAGLLRYCAHADDRGRVVGRARDLAPALLALRDTDRETPRFEASVDDVDARAVLDVLFGPRRALSDPASKAALKPYDIPLPVEELCASASRAASEATRIGFPVRISLVSPDLRIWDHPDLAVDMVDNAARVRDTFRQLMGVARSRLEPSDPRAAERLLGVMVTATSDAIALLGVRAWPVARDRVAMEVGFADQHGAAADDRTLAVLPAPVSAIERALRRLAGRDLLLRGTAAQRRAHLDAVGEVLLRLSTFVHERRREVESVELRPLAVLLDGSTEVRQACVSVSDAFERSLSAPAATGS